MRAWAKVFMLATLTCQLLGTFSGQEIRNEIKQIRSSERGREFLKDHSEENLYKIMLFATDPVKYFISIQDIKDWFGYVEIWDSYLIRSNKTAKGYLGTLLEHFRDINPEKVEILTFLVLNSKNCGLYQEAMGARYARLFSASPGTFIEDLEKRKNWRDVIGLILVGGWYEFKVGVAKLGDSEFEKELKAYLAELERRDTHLRIPNP